MQEFNVTKFGFVNLIFGSIRFCMCVILLVSIILSVMAVCEMWLVPAVSSSFVIDGFQVLHDDGSKSVR